MTMKRSAPPRPGRRVRAISALAAVTAACLLTGGTAPGSKAPAAPADEACPTSLPDSFWRAPVDKLPAHPKSAQYIASIGADKPLHPDFGSGLTGGQPFGIPITVSDAQIPETKVTLDYPEESEPSGYRIPPDAAIENGPASTGDRHVIVWDRALCKAYELWNATPQDAHTWHAGSGAIFDLTSNKLRPDGWTSADAAGLAILPGLARYEEAASGSIDHAIRITVPRSDQSYLWPARHQAGAAADNTLPPMGLRLRLKNTVDTTQLPPQAKAVAEALKKYGVIVADNGSPWYISGDQNPSWNNTQLDTLKAFKGTDFEAVDASALQQDPNTGTAVPPQ